MFENTNEDLSGKSGVSEALISEPFNLYHKAGVTIDLSKDKYTIAFVGKRNLLQQYLQEKYPNCSVVSCESPKDCIERLGKDEVDLAYLNVHIASNILTEQGIDDIRELPIEEKMNGIGLLVQGENSELIASVVNKGIQHMDTAELSNSMVSYALTTQEHFTWKKIVEDYTGWMITGAIVIIIVLLTIVFLTTYAKVMRREKDKVEQADADRSEFFARMSHDMRTPMNGILGMIHISKKTKDVEEIYKNLSKAESSGEYMLNLINDTLDLQKLEAGKLKLQWDIVYAKDYFDGIFSMLKMMADKKNIEFKVTNINMDTDKYVRIDKIRVKQIFTNLLSNAIKFTAEQGIVEVVMESIENEAGELHQRFEIRDSGIGMSEEFIKNKIFTPYAQENNKVTSELTGTGLGLAITKNLVDAMGGSLEVESELGEGSTFTLCLDFRKVSEEEVEAEQKKRSHKVNEAQIHLEGRKILLCEDHPLNAEIARKLLEKVGCKVTWAANGALGVEQMEQSQEGYFDAVLMDIRMPVMDGLEAAKTIRELPREDAKQIPIIAMTANAYEEDRKKSMEAGMNAHLAKPVQPALMYETLAKYMERG